MTLKRIALWTHPRSLSTAMVMSFGNYGNVDVFNEYYGGAFAFGPEKKVTSPLPVPIPPEKDLTYDAVKAMLEAEHPGKELVFLKDHAVSLNKKYDKLPDGFIHTFLIRDPAKMLTSNLKLGLKSGMTAEQYVQFSQMMFGKSLGYEDLVGLVNHVEKTLNQQALILDADDLQRDPEMMLRGFCSVVDLPFRKSLLKWDPITEIPWHIPKSLLAFNQASGAYENALKSTGWMPSDPKPVDLTSVPNLLLGAMEDILPFYEILHAKRLIKP